MDRVKKIIKNYKLYYWLIILVALFMSISTVINRVISDNENKKVELVMSYSALKHIGKLNGISMNHLLPQFLKSGISTIAVEEMTIESLVSKGKVTFKSGYEILNTNRLQKNYSNLMSYLNKVVAINPDYQYIIVAETSIYDAIKNAVIRELGSDNIKELGWQILEVKADEKDLNEIAFGFDSVLIKSLVDYGFSIIPRIKNSYRLDKENIGVKYNELSSLPTKINKIIYDGTSILGYPANLDMSAQKIKKYNYIFGYIEFAKQQGESYICKKNPENVMKVHSITPEEMINYSPQKAVKRMFRAVHERNIRILYVNPFIEGKYRKNMMENNITYINLLTKAIKSNGYLLGDSSQKDLSKISPFNGVRAFMVLLAIWCVLMLLSEYFVSLSSLTHFLSFIPVGLVCFFISMTGDSLHKYLALIIAIVFPVYAVISQFPSDRYEKSYSIKEISLKVLMIWFIAMIGATYIVSILSTPDYLLGVSSFVGVKLAFLIPVVFIGLYFFIQPHRFKSFMYVVSRAIARPITNGYLFLFIIICLMLVFYITRSGNNFVIPMTKLEAIIRGALENLFYARPRTKEIFLAYPVMVFSLFGFFRFIKYKDMWLTAAVTTIAPITVINTFSHIHSPVLVSLFRELAGLCIGVINGVILIYIFLLAKKIFKLIENR